MAKEYSEAKPVASDLVFYPRALNVLQGRINEMHEEYGGVVPTAYRLREFANQAIRSIDTDKETKLAALALAICALLGQLGTYKGVE